MLGLRLLTGIPLAVAAIWFILTQSTISLSYVFIVISAIAGWEWARLSGIKLLALRVVYAVVLTAVVFLCIEYLRSFINIINSLAVIWWLAVIVFLSRVKSIAATETVSAIKLLLGFVTLVPPMLAMLQIHAFNQGPAWLLFGMSIVWVADIGAYFSGRRFGKVKLAPVLSPGKTREGFYGAMAATLIYTLIAAVVYFELNTTQVMLLLLLTAIVTVYSVAGDLFESLLKRQAGVKDSGAILPGHGGILDRIDSLTATMSLFALGSASLLAWV